MPSNLAQAFAYAEGFGVSSSNIPTSRNNPGDLTSGGVINTYDSPDTGWAALESQIGKMVNGTSSVYSPDMSLTQVGNLYSNGDPNWAKNVASYLGVSPSTTIADAANGTSTSSSLTSAVSAVTSPLAWLEANLENAVGIVVGLILIAAGVMSFKSTSTVINTIGAHAGKVAEIATA